MSAGPAARDRSTGAAASLIDATRMSQLRWIARGWCGMALLGFVLLAFVVGVPQGPEGTLIAGSHEASVQLALLVVTALGLAVAWRWETIGGCLIVLAAAAIGVFAAFEYRPLAALLPFVALLLPGLVFLVGGLRLRPWPWLAAAAVMLLAVLTASGLAAQWAYDWSFGPTHPESPLAAQPVDVVEWAWSGALTPTGARVSVRIDTPRPSTRLLVSPRADLSVERRTLEPKRRSDGGAVLGFDVSGLRPKTSYYYAVEVDGHVDRTRIGRIRTPGIGADSFTLAFGGDARRGSNGAVFDAIRGLDPLLYLVLGDIFYGDIDEDDPARFRAELDTALTRPAQQALYLSVPTAYTWDDHDYGPDDADSTSSTRSAAQRVYREYVPHFELPGGVREGSIQQAFTLGRMRVIMTDSRSNKTPRSASDDVRKSLLGSAQRAWLERELLAARDRYPLILLVTSVPWIGQASAGADSWAGYSTERRALSRFIADNSIEGVVMLAGDAHMIAFDDGSNSDYSGTGRARIPVFHAAALDRHGGSKGGPYSGGTHPGSGQFGTVTVLDDGQRMTVTLRGLDYTGREVIRHRMRLPAE